LTGKHALGLVAPSVGVLASGGHGVQLLLLLKLIE
jgi:hypothetical protein